jgi:hypothetical protein
MNDNGNTYALAALKHQRASLAGKIVSLETSLAWKEAIPAMRHRVRASLQYLSREKHSVAKQGSGSKVTWSLAA